MAAAKAAISSAAAGRSFAQRLCARPPLVMDVGGAGLGHRDKSDPFVARVSSPLDQSGFLHTSTKTMIAGWVTPWMTARSVIRRGPPVPKSPVWMPPVRLTLQGMLRMPSVTNPYKVALTAVEVRSARRSGRRDGP